MKGGLMKAEKGKYVVFEYCLSLESGEELPIKNVGRPIGFVLGEGHMLPAVEAGIQGMEAGESALILLEPEEAFGKYDDTKIREVDRSNFPPGVELKPTMSFQGRGPDGPVDFVIKSVDDDVVVVDLNHPLAGKRLRCDLKIHEVREITEEEKARMQGFGFGTGEGGPFFGMFGDGVKV